MIRSVLAPNPGPMTLEGTNTWIVDAPGGALVIDPGPDADSHVDAILDACPRGIAEVWLTHHHLDHVEVAPRLADLVEAPIRAADPDLCRDAAPLTPDEGATFGGHEVQVVALPGHTRDSLGFVVDDALIAGDMILGRGTTVIMHPDGDLAAYLGSLDRIDALAAEGVRRILPAHGPDLDDVPGVVGHYRKHRHERLAQVRAAVDAGARTAEDVVATVYRDVPAEVRFAAQMSVQSQLDYLNGEDAR